MFLGWLNLCFSQEPTALKLKGSSSGLDPPLMSYNEPELKSTPLADFGGVWAEQAWGQAWAGFWMNWKPHGWWDGE